MKTKPTTRFSPAFPLAMAIATMLCAPGAQAANISWSGVTDAAWNTNTNWVGDALPLSNDSLGEIFLSVKTLKSQRAG